MGILGAFLAIKVPQGREPDSNKPKTKWSPDMHNQISEISKKMKISEKWLSLNSPQPPPSMNQNKKNCGNVTNIW